MSAPAADELRAYLAGTLPAERFAAVDAWIAGLEPDAAERVLAGLDAAAPPIAGLAAAVEPGFRPDGGARHHPGEPLGEGGMAEVRALRDQALERTVALKVLKPRRADEPLDAFLLRQAAFRREAAVTAALEHPAIVPVHDVGAWAGRPAFAMQRLSGRSLDRVVAEDGAGRAELIPLLLRVAEAVAFAHSRGVVHRDLTPANILVGDFGAVHVLDWGAAERAGAAATAIVGTPAWMAPEQAAGGAVDPRQDVFALGGLLGLALTGRGPRPAGAPPGDIDLSALGGRRVPPALAAVARRCLRRAPAERYADAQAVADDLRRWLGEGLTAAQQLRPWERAWLRLRRSPRALPAAGMLAAAALGVGAVWWWQAAADRAAAERRLGELAAVPLDRPEALDLALADVRAVRARHPGLAAAAVLEARLAAARDVAAAAEAAAALRARLAGLLRRIRIAGPWTDQTAALREALGAAGLRLEPATAAADAARLAASPVAGDLAQALAFLWRAERERGADAAAAASAALLGAGGPTPGWRALGHVLAISEFRAHDPVFCPCPESEVALADPAPAAAAVAIFAAEPRLTAYARARLAADPGDFWPLIAAARAALLGGDAAAARALAYTALGAEPGSLLPRLLLAYAGLGLDDAEAVLAQTAAGLAVDPAHAELLTLRAAGLARAGRTAEGQALIDRIPAGHLRYHLSHRVGHLMERAVDAAVAAGLAIPPAPPELGPLSPGERHHH